MSQVELIVRSELPAVGRTAHDDCVGQTGKRASREIPAEAGGRRGLRPTIHDFFGRRFHAAAVSIGYAAKAQSAVRQVARGIGVARVLAGVLWQPNNAGIGSREGFADFAISCFLESTNVAICIASLAGPSTARRPALEGGAKRSTSSHPPLPRNDRNPCRFGRENLTNVARSKARFVRLRRVESRKARLNRGLRDCGKWCRGVVQM